MIALLASLAPIERIVAVDNYVLAHTVQGRWRAPDDAFVRGHGATTFRPFGLGRVGGATRTTPFEQSPNGGGPSLKAEDVRPLLAGGAPQAPRRVRPGLGYEAETRRFLETHGVNVARARVTRVLRVDLDGDGTDEVLVEATNGDIAYSASKGAYSLVLLRAVRGGRVVETALEMLPNRPGGVMHLAQVRAVADLDGDGRMEVLTTISGIDTLGARLWGYRKGRATMLAENGVGA